MTINELMLIGTHEALILTPANGCPVRMVWLTCDPAKLHPEATVIRVTTKRKSQYKADILSALPMELERL